MNPIIKLINVFVDLIYCPKPSCKEKPLGKFEMITFLIGIIGIAVLLWMLKMGS